MRAPPPLVVVVPERVTLPPLRLRLAVLAPAPEPENVVLPPETRMVPVPVTIPLELNVKLPPVRAKTAPEATLTIPELVPPPAMETEPDWTLKVPELLTVASSEVSPVAVDLVKVPELLKTSLVPP